MKKNDDATKSLLIQESTKQFAFCGFSKASVRSICHVVNVSIASINYHFGNKENLIKEVVDNAIYSFLEIIENSYKHSPDNIRDFLSHYAHELNKLEAQTLLIFRKMFHHDLDKRELDTKINDIHEVFHSKVKLILNLKSEEYVQEHFDKKITLFSSLVVLEAIKKSILPTHIKDEQYAQWIDDNLNILFPKEN